VRRWGTGGGASARDGDDGHDEDQEEESWRCESLRQGGVAFYRVEARRGKARIGRVAVVNGILNGAITGVKGGGEEL
jgi:hypothetical protein